MINKHIDNFIYLMSFLATISALTVLVYFQYFYAPPLPSNAIESQKFIEGEKENSYPKEFELKQIIVNLKSKTKRLRFLEIKIFLVPYDQNHKKILEQNQDLIYDSIIDMASGMDPDELNTLSGKLILQSRIISDLNKLLKAKIVKELHLSRYVVI